MHRCFVPCYRAVTGRVRVNGAVVSGVGIVRMWAVFFTCKSKVDRKVQSVIDEHGKVSVLVMLDEVGDRRGHRGFKMGYDTHETTQ